MAKKGINPTLIGIVVVAILVIAIFSFVLFQEKKAVDPSDIQDVPTPTPTPQETPQDNTKTFEITASQWKFDPATITVKKGDKVKFIIKSIDVDHGIAIPAFGINKKLAVGETVEFEFTADRKGTYIYACNVFCGTGHGAMQGTLLVQE